MTLHSLACSGWAECRCAVLYRVRDSGSGIEQKCDNTGDARREWDSTVEAEIAYTRSAPAVPAIPGAVGVSRFHRGIDR